VTGIFVVVAAAVLVWIYFPWLRNLHAERQKKKEEDDTFSSVRADVGQRPQEVLDRLRNNPLPFDEATYRISNQHREILRRLRVRGVRCPKCGYLPMIMSEITTTHEQKIAIGCKCRTMPSVELRESTNLSVLVDFMINAWNVAMVAEQKAV